MESDDKEFACRLAEQTIRQILPIALRAVGLEDAALRCEKEGTRTTAVAAADAAWNLWLSWSATVTGPIADDAWAAAESAWHPDDAWPTRAARAAKAAARAADAVLL